MEPRARDELQQELYWDEDLERRRHRHRHRLFYVPQAPAGRRFIITLMIVLWGGGASLGAAASALLRGLPPTYQVSDLWGAVLLAEQELQTGLSLPPLSKHRSAEPELFTERPCVAADFGLAKRERVPQVVGTCFTFARPALLPRERPVYRPL